MGEKTGITWTDHTFNPWIGCTKVSAGCRLCYAESQNKRFNWNPAGWGENKPRHRTSMAYWGKPIQWAEQAQAAGVKRRVFCASLADVFDIEVDPLWRHDLFLLIGWIEMHYPGALEWLILTKRPMNIYSMFPFHWGKLFTEVIRMGVTAEDQENAERRIPELLSAWPGKTFVSFEPLLSPIMFKIDWLPILIGDGPDKFQGIDWAIVGGESGAGCRPMNPDWARYIRDRCREARVPFFFKQMGGHPDKRHDPAGWPDDLNIQEFPA